MGIWSLCWMSAVCQHAKIFKRFVFPRKEYTGETAYIQLTHAQQIISKIQKQQPKKKYFIHIEQQQQREKTGPVDREKRVCINRERQCDAVELELELKVCAVCMHFRRHTKYMQRGLF